VTDQKNEVGEGRDQMACERHRDSGSHARRRTQVVEKASLPIHCALQEEEALLLHPGAPIFALVLAVKAKPLHSDLTGVFRLQSLRSTSGSLLRGARTKA
jgi:hypothetical protein